MVQSDQKAGEKKEAPVASKKQDLSKKGDLKSKLAEFIKPLKDWFMKFSFKERIAYPLIIVGVICIIIGVLLW